MALKKDGTVWAWGSNANGRLGNGTYITSLTPVKVSILTGVEAIAAGGEHSMALKQDGTVWGWGSNVAGQVSYGRPAVSSKLPVKASYMDGHVAAIYGGGQFSLIALAKGIPGVTLNRRSVDFSLQAIGKASATQAITLTNSGTASLKIHASTLTGLNAGDFTRTADSCSGAILSPGAQCDISVRFAPTAIGGRSTGLLINSNGPQSPHLIVLSGTGTH